MKDAERKEVDLLLEQYKNYRQISEQERRISTQLARAKLRGEPVESLAQEYSRLKTRLQSLSDSMTFASPLIWMAYKYEAYADERQPIRTMHDFRVHCSKPGYICTKRFDFLNAQLRSRHYTSLTDETAYPDDIELNDIFDTPPIRNLIKDKKFMTAWNNYEHNAIDSKTAKWENYPYN